MFNNLNILSVFFEHPNKEIGVRELANMINISPATASKRLKKLNKKGFLTCHKLRKIHLYKANLENSEYSDLKTYYNIRKLRESGLIEAVNEQYLKPTIILFGSASKGLDTEDSDFDLVIITENEQEFKKKKVFEKKLKKEIHLFIVKNLKGLKNNHLINNVLNGIILQGEVTWI